MSQTLPITDYKWIEDISDFDEIFMKFYEERYFLKADVQYTDSVYNLHNDLPFFHENKN